MRKKYEAKSCVSVSILIDGKNSAHVNFVPRTSGGSVFYTDNEKIQEGLERHPKFGRLFHLNGADEAPSQPEKKEVVSAAAPSDVANTKDFCCNDDAKDYLADKFGVSRSSMRTRSAIEDVAKSHGVVINWTDK